MSGDVIPYAFLKICGSSDNRYTNSDARIWLNDIFADTLSVAQRYSAGQSRRKVEETEDSSQIGYSVFLLMR